MILLDTCSLIWWALDPEKLSDKAQTACGRMEETGGIISSISIWEIGIKIKNKKLDIGVCVGEFLRRVKATKMIEIVPVDETIWVDNLNLNWEHRDSADRTIVATAKKFNAPIVTKDHLIRDYYKNCIWS